MGFISRYGRGQLSLPLVILLIYCPDDFWGSAVFVLFTVFNSFLVHRERLLGTFNLYSNSILHHNYNLTTPHFYNFSNSIWLRSAVVTTTGCVFASAQLYFIGITNYILESRYCLCTGARSY